MRSLVRALAAFIKFKVLAYLKMFKVLMLQKIYEQQMHKNTEGCAYTQYDLCHFCSHDTGQVFQESNLSLLLKRLL